jgi:hypothetical protein
MTSHGENFVEEFGRMFARHAQDRGFSIAPGGLSKTYTDNRGFGVARSFEVLLPVASQLSWSHEVSWTNNPSNGTHAWFQWQRQPKPDEPDVLVSGITFRNRNSARLRSLVRELESCGSEIAETARPDITVSQISFKMSRQMETDLSSYDDVMIDQDWLIDVVFTCRDWLLKAI